MRLIDADALLAGIYSDNPSDIMFYVASQPEAIIRCKDCKFHTDDDECTNPHWDCKESEVYPTAYEYDFCSYGKRKEE